jgi:hypothetical protein
VISNLDDHARAALILIYASRGKLKNPVPETDAVVHLLRRVGSSLSEASKGLTTMRDSLVRLEAQDDGQYWVFQHPSMEDAMSDALTGSSRALGRVPKLRKPE